MFIKAEQKNLADTIKKCWEKDPAIQQFSRNWDCDLEERISREVECLKKAGDTFKFYEIFTEDGIFVGYYGQESYPLPWLTTIFVMPEFRKQAPQIWEFIASQFPEKFYSGLFKINVRAIKFYEKMGGRIVGKRSVEDKPAVTFIFDRSNK